MSSYLAAVLSRADGRPVLARRPRALFEPLSRTATAAAAMTWAAAPGSGAPIDAGALLDGRPDARQGAGESAGEWAAVRSAAAAADMDFAPAAEAPVSSDAARRPARVASPAGMAGVHSGSTVALAPILAEGAEGGPGVEWTALAARTAPGPYRDAAHAAATTPPVTDAFTAQARNAALGALHPAPVAHAATVAPPPRLASHPRAARELSGTASAPPAATLSDVARAAAAGTARVNPTAAAVQLDARAHMAHATLAALRARPQLQLQLQSLRAAAAAPPPLAAAAALPSVQVSIGRIDVRAMVASTAAATAPRPASAAAPALSLDAYLRRRHGGDRDGVAR